MRQTKIGHACMHLSHFKQNFGCLIEMYLSFLVQLVVLVRFGYMPSKCGANASPSHGATPGAQIFSTMQPLNSMCFKYKMAAAYLLLMEEENYKKRNYERVNRRFIRDSQNPFDLPISEFKKNYRYPQDVCLEIVDMLRPFAREELTNTRITLETRLLVAMNFYSQGSYQRAMSKDYHHPVGQSTASTILTEITDLIIEAGVQPWLKFPITAEEQQAAKMGFFLNFNMSGILFAVDGTKVAIYPPPVEHPVYPERLFVDRRGHHSINVQITCDAEKNITSMNARYPGSVHDTFIWRNSDVRQFVQEGYANGTLRNTYGLGDSGYPMEPWLLTPYPEGDQLAPFQADYRAHKHARVVEEETIGAWKNTMRCMGRFRSLHYNPTRAAKLCIATAILYNIGRRRNVIDDDAIALPIVVEDGDVPTQINNNALRCW